MKLIPLTKGEWAICDDQDYDLVMQHKWHLCVSPGKKPYARTNIKQENGKQKSLLMHRLIRPHDGVATDHKSGDSLDNRYDNIRPATDSQNNHNRNHRLHSSRYKGVSKHGQKWQAHITIDKKRKHLGTFLSEEDAGRTYDSMALKHFGEFAKTNKEMGLL